MRYCPKTKIAQELRISRSTLYNELKRGTVEQISTNLVKHTKYYGDAGQRVYNKNRENSRNSLKLMKVFEFIKYAEKEILIKKHSPDSIVGRSKLLNLFSVEEMVCTKTLYNYIDRGYLNVKNIDLPLRVKLKVKTKKDKKRRKILGESIDNRPEIINKREEFGHWEIDTIEGKKENHQYYYP